MDDIHNEYAGYIFYQQFGFMGLAVSQRSTMVLVKDFKSVARGNIPGHKDAAALFTTEDNGTLYITPSSSKYGMYHEMIHAQQWAYKWSCVFAARDEAPAWFVAQRGLQGELQYFKAVEDLLRKNDIEGALNAWDAAGGIRGRHSPGGERQSAPGLNYIVGTDLGTKGWAMNDHIIPEDVDAVLKHLGVRYSFSKVAPLYDKYVADHGVDLHHNAAGIFSI